MTAPLAEVVEEGRRLAEAATSRNWDNAGFPAPLPWRATADPVPMVWADDGDAVVMQMPNGEPYFEQPVAEFIAFAANNLVRLLAVAEAGQRLAAKLDEIKDSPAYMGVFGLAHVHGHDYDGPTWEAERAAFDAAARGEK